MQVPRPVRDDFFDSALGEMGIQGLGKYGVMSQPSHPDNDFMPLELPDSATLPLLLR